jgi:tetratricopeptide (TPR) repeat protein
MFPALMACAQTGNKPAPNANTNTAASSKTSLQYLELGSAYYLQRDYAGAIGPYQKALDLEKQDAKLDKTLWRVLIDNLGMSYGITGDLEKAKETFEYGISKDDEYPLFYYNMACTYAEMDNEDKAIEYLRGAYERKENMIKGEHFPEASTDSSFKKFMKSEKFVSALAEMKKPKKEKQ